MTSIPLLWQRVLRGCGSAGWILLIALVLAPAMSGCQTEAQDRDFNFNNPLDPNPDDGDDDGDNTGQIVIFFVDDVGNVVVLQNAGTEDTDMTGWTLENEDASATFTFPGFTLDAGQAVRVHSESGSNGPNDLFTGSTSPNWSGTTPNREAFLLDASGDPIDNCENGSECWP